MILSISIVSYNTKDLLKKCINSIYEKIKKIDFEIVVVDNGSKDGSIEMIKKCFPKVLLIQNKKNQFFSKANNQALKIATGKYFLLLNSDTYFTDNSLHKMIDYMETHKKIGALEGLEIDEKKVVIPNGSRHVTPQVDFYELSFIGKRFKKNNIISDYRLQTFKRNEIFAIDVGCDAFLLARTKLLNKINGYDQDLKMYYTENDLCKRIQEEGYEIIHLGTSRVVHSLSKSVNKIGFYKKLNLYYQDLLAYYWKNDYKIAGLLLFLLLKLEELILFVREHISIILIIIIGLFLRFYKLDILMPFIGDFGWFYISARDIILTGSIPLIGITSSQTWLHQGPLWTYLLALPLYISGFNPLSGAYLSVIIGAITVFLVYKLGSEMFSKKVGIIAGLLYACSPLVIIHSRMPYHTSVIPLFTAIFLLVFYRWIKGNVIYFPWIIFSLGMLYNFELSTVVLWFIMFMTIFCGVIYKKTWVKKIIAKKIIFFSALAFIIPMFPILLYDIQHGFLQTLKFANWLIYHRVIKSLLEFNIQDSFFSTTYSMVAFLIEQCTRLIFLPNTQMSVIIFVFSLTWLGIKILKMLNKKLFKTNYLILFLSIVIPLFAFIFGQTPSEAYMPIFFPTVIILIALFLNKLSSFKPLFVPTILTITLICFLNVYTLISSDYLMKKPGAYGPTFRDRLKASKEIISIVNNKEYNLIALGQGSEHKSFTTNYEYLAWWLGNGPSKSEKELKVLIKEDKGKIYVTQLN